MPSFIRFQKSAGSRRASKIILAVIAAIFGVGAFFSFGGSPGRNPMGSVPDAFTVNGKTISMAEFSQTLENYENQMQMYGGSKGDPTRERAMQLAVMKEIITDTALRQDAAQRKLAASGEDVQKARLEWIQQQTASLGEGAAKQKALIEENMTETEFNDRIQQRAESAAMQQYFTNKIIMEKLEEAVSADAQITDEHLEQSYTQVSLRHVLVKYDPKATETADAAKPKSVEAPAKGDQADKTKDKDDNGKVTRTKTAAEKLANELYARAKKGEDLAAIAKTESDDWSATSGGQVTLQRGDYTSEQLGDAFTDAVYKAKVGELSKPVEVKDGFSVFRVESRKTTKPDDFAEKKEEYRKQKLDQKKSRMFAEYRDELQESAEVEVIDEQLKAFKLIEDGKKQEALALLRKICADRTKPVEGSNGDDADQSERRAGAVVWYEIAKLEQDLGNPQEADAAFAKAIEEGECPALHLEYGNFLRAQNRRDDALQAYQAASEAATVRDVQIRYALRAVYEEMGEKDLAAAQQAEIEKATQSSGMGGMGGMPLNLPMSP